MHMQLLYLYKVMDKKNLCGEFNWIVLIEYDL